MILGGIFGKGITLRANTVGVEKTFLLIIYIQSQEVVRQQKTT